MGAEMWGRLGLGATDADAGECGAGLGSELSVALRRRRGPGSRRAPGPPGGGGAGRAGGRGAGGSTRRAGVEDCGSAGSRLSGAGEGGSSLNKEGSTYKDGMSACLEGATVGLGRVSVGVSAGLEGEDGTLATGNGTVSAIPS
jgi:hypothetical protein